MRETSYVDDIGRHWAVMLPEHEPQSRAHLGIPIGPIDVTPLAEEFEWPQDFHVRLHNQLFHAHVYQDDERILRARSADIIGAITRAAKVDAQRIIDLIADPAILSLDGETEKAT